MPLSADETAAAKKAYSEIRACDTLRTTLTLFPGLFLFIIFLFGIFFASGMPAEDHGKFLKGWQAFLSFLSVLHGPLLICALPVLGQVFTYRRLRPRYAGNLKVVTDLEKKYAGELPYGLEPEINSANSRSRKAILWRLDAFLSRKPIKVDV